MSCSVLKEIVYKGRNNPNSVTFEQDGVEIDFSAATRMLVDFEGISTSADTADNAGLIDYSQGSGLVEFNFNGLDIPAGLYRASVVVFDALHTDGQVLVYHDENKLQFRFVDANVNN